MLVNITALPTTVPTAEPTIVPIPGNIKVPIIIPAYAATKDDPTLIAVLATIYGRLIPLF